MIQNILNQLGGKRFAMMVGAKDHIALENGVRFKIGKNSSATNTVTVVYDSGKDLYNMTFEKVSLSRKTWNVSRKIIHSCDGVFGDQLQDIFTDVTGMFTKLSSTPA